MRIGKGAGPMRRLKPIPGPRVATRKGEHEYLLLLPALGNDRIDRSAWRMVLARLWHQRGQPCTVPAANGCKLRVVFDSHVVLPERLLRQELAERLWRLGPVHGS